MFIFHPWNNIVLLIISWVFFVLPVSVNCADSLGVITGNVVSYFDDENGVPLPDITIQIQELQVRTETNNLGQFGFKGVPAGQYSISMEVWGCQLESKVVEIRTGEVVTLIFSLDKPVFGLPNFESNFSYSELPYSVGQLDSTDLDGHPGHTIADLIRGEFPGVKIMQGSGQPGDEISIHFRGRRSLSTEQVPLIVMDGVITGGGMVDINPRDVQDISVLKGSSASAHYGSRGQAGVIEITTKSVTKNSVRIGPFVILDGVFSSMSVIDIDPISIKSMELANGDVSRALFGSTSPEAGVVLVRTVENLIEEDLTTCFGLTKLK